MWRRRPQSRSIIRCNIYIMIFTGKVKLNLKLQYNTVYDALWWCIGYTRQHIHHIIQCRVGVVRPCLNHSIQYKYARILQSYRFKFTILFTFKNIFKTICACQQSKLSFKLQSPILGIVDSTTIFLWGIPLLTK